ncbi:MAG: hypothetical protein A2100_03060 [Sideroxydans sp. GWF2_59_14]|nr:MAG: hypothetical protein A2100_03060 [Sideroxydans sp. GWF2_59_14]HAF45534.1 hypothetical protein [Gallionellaceae bacterium]
MDRRIDREEEDAAEPVESGSLRARLKVIAHYALLTAPVVALLALALAIAALVFGRSAPPRADDSSARIESLGASLTETKNELESLKFTLARERSQRAEERKKAEEREAAIIRHVSRLQSKSKVSPTLEEQLKAAENVPGHAAPVSAPVPAAAAAATAATAHAVTTAPVVEETKPAVVPAATVADKPHAAPATVEKKPVATAPPATEKTPAQLKALKDAIDKLNKK